MIPFLDLKAQYQSIKPQIDKAVIATLASGHYALGAEVEALEEEFSEYSGARFGVAVNSGTSALHLALLAAGVGPGDEVITVANTFVATVAAIDYTGAKAVFVDVDYDTLTMNPQMIEAAITEKTKAILPVHLHGHPADLDSILDIARHHNLLVIEDACQAHGAEYKGKRVGGIGDLGCFSFYPGKNLGAYGEGGMVVTQNEALADKIRCMRDWGQTKKYHHVYKGFNYRMDAIQGAILRVKLRHLDDWTQARRLNSEYYQTRLVTSGLELPVEKNWAKHVFHVYAIKLDKRQELRNKLGGSEISSGIHYPIPIHQQPAYKSARLQVLPVTEAVAGRTLSLPMFPELSEANIETVCDVIKQTLYG